MKIILGNWKMHGSRDMVRELLTKLVLTTFDAQKITVGVLPPFVYLPDAQALLAQSQIKLGAQTVSEHERGAFTGEVAASMVRECGCDYVLVGHSERRHVFGESDQQVAAKFWQAHKHQLIPVLCVGETLAEREANQTEAIIQAQMAVVFAGNHHILPEQWVIAYEPVWAIGTGKAATIDQVQAVHRFIQYSLAKWFGADAAQRIAILYGGSVKPDNAHEIMQLNEVHGVLVGGASLDAAQFEAIIAAA